VVSRVEGGGVAKCEGESRGESRGKNVGAGALRRVTNAGVGGVSSVGIEGTGGDVMGVGDKGRGSKRLQDEGKRSLSKSIDDGDGSSRAGGVYWQVTRSGGGSGEGCGGASLLLSTRKSCRVYAVG
jgi:hypothetical protein